MDFSILPFRGFVRFHAAELKMSCAKSSSQTIFAFRPAFFGVDNFPSSILFQPLSPTSPVN